MAAYEHIAVLISFVVSLGFAHVLVGLASLIQSPAKVRVSLPHALWALVAVAVLLDTWLGLFDYRETTRWLIPQILLIVAQAGGAYLLAALVMPASFVIEGSMDLQAFHEQQRKTYTRAFIAFMALDAALPFAFATEPPGVADAAQVLVALAVTIAVPVASLLFKRRWLEIAAPLWLFGLLVAYWIAFPKFG